MAAGGLQAGDDIGRRHPTIVQHVGLIIPTYACIHGQLAYCPVVLRIDAILVISKLQRRVSESVSRKKWELPVLVLAELEIRCAECRLGHVVVGSVRYDASLQRVASMPVAVDAQVVANADPLLLQILLIVL